MAKKKANSKQQSSGRDLNVRLGAEAPVAESVKPINIQSPDEIVVSEEERISLLIPEESENLADKEINAMATDSVRSYYTFINLVALVIAAFTIALTLLFIREGEQYSADNIQLSGKTFLDGSYTASLSNRYINEMKLDDLVGNLSEKIRYIYGFGADAPLTPVIPDPLVPSGSYPQDTETTTWYYEDDTTTEATQPADVSVNDSFSGTPVTMPTVTIDVESDFTGIIKHTTTTTTTSLTTTQPYSYTATASSSTKKTTTAKTTTAKTTTSATKTTTTTPAATTTPPPATTPPPETTTPEETPPVTEPSETEPEVPDISENN